MKDTIILGTLKNGILLGRKKFGFLRERNKYFGENHFNSIDSRRILRQLIFTKYALLRYDQRWRRYYGVLVIKETLIVSRLSKHVYCGVRKMGEWALASGSVNRKRNWPLWQNRLREKIIIKLNHVF